MTLQDVLDTTCHYCGGIPCTEELPSWVYDEYDECVCAFQGWTEKEFEEILKYQRLLY